MSNLWHTLTTMDKATVDQFLFWWCLVGIASFVAIHAVKLMPISGREQNTALSFLGTVKKRTGWIIMETPILVSVGTGFLAGNQPLNPGAIIVGLFVAHYINRALIFPYRIKADGKTMAVSMLFMTMTFYIINGYLVGYYFGALVHYPTDWLWDPRFLAGVCLFLFGWFVNIQSDNILINLRGPGETGYKIPHGGFFRYVSCPNYMGECLEWIGFALMSWNMMGTVYAIWVVLPLVAQAALAHRWYREKFGAEYPPERKAIIPGLY